MLIICFFGLYKNVFYAFHYVKLYKLLSQHIITHEYTNIYIYNIHIRIAINVSTIIINYRLFLFAYFLPILDRLVNSWKRQSRIKILYICTCRQLTYCKYSTYGQKKTYTIFLERLKRQMRTWLHNSTTYIMI